jgi:hypothetical protein
VRRERRPHRDHRQDRPGAEDDELDGEPSRGEHAQHRCDGQHGTGEEQRSLHTLPKNAVPREPHGDR